MEKKWKTLSPAELRRQAEEKLTQRPARPEASPADLQRLVHELQVHQIELELQNEALHQAQGETRAALERYRNLAELVPIGVYTTVYDPTMPHSQRVAFVNQRLCDMIGVEQEDLMRDISRAFAVAELDERSRMEKLADDSTLNGTPFCYEGRFKIRGETRWLSVYSQPNPKREGIVEWNGVVSDITERRQAELDLQKHKEELEQRVQERTAEIEDFSRQLRDTVFALESVGTAIYRVDADTGQLFYANRCAAEMLGYSPHEMLTLRVPEFDLQFDTPSAFAAAATEVRTKGSLRFETIHRHKDGHSIPVEMTVYTQPNPQGSSTHFIAFAVDITERRTAQLALQQAQEQLRLALDAGKIGTFEWDLATNEAICNDWHNRLWGYPPGEGIHAYADYARRIHPDDLGDVEVALHQIRDTRAPFHAEFRVVWPDGSEHWITERGDYQYDDQGHPVRMYGTVLDITDRKLSEEAREIALMAAENLARLRQEFLANMSHELRTPLNGILGFAEIGIRKYQDTDKARDAFQKIRQSGTHLLGVVNDILDFSKIEQGKLNIESVPVDLCQIKDEALDHVRDLAQNKNLSLRVEMAPEFPSTVQTDPLRLRQILSNLLSNAVKFTETGGVRLAVSRRQDTLVFEVIDSGIGMTQEHVDRLFQPFEQADGSFSRKYGGTGLGLAITERLVRLMGGSIEAQSSPGNGSRFTVRLPYRPGDEAPATIKPESLPSQPEAGPALLGIRVLLAEDDEINRFVADDLLSQAGATVTAVTNGSEAVERVVTDGPESYDVILMDIQMPVMDGFEATQIIQAMAPELPIISLSAHALEEELALFDEAGMVAHVTKPFFPDQLIGTVRIHARSHERELKNDNR